LEQKIKIKALRILATLASLVGIGVSLLFAILNASWLSLCLDYLIYLGFAILFTLAIKGEWF